MGKVDSIGWQGPQHPTARSPRVAPASPSSRARMVMAPPKPAHTRASGRPLEPARRSIPCLTPRAEQARLARPWGVQKPSAPALSRTCATLPKAWLLLDTRLGHAPKTSIRSMRTGSSLAPACDSEVTGLRPPAGIACPPGGPSIDRPPSWNGWGPANRPMATTCVTLRPGPLQARIVRSPRCGPGPQSRTPGLRAGSGSRSRGRSARPRPPAAAGAARRVRRPPP